MRMRFAAIILFLAPVGCGSGAKPAAALKESAIAIAPDSPSEGSAASSDRDGITAIDAASGDGRAMPTDSFAPSAYDLARRADRGKEAEASRDALPESDAPAAPAQLGAPADLLGTDESVTAGD